MSRPIAAILLLGFVFVDFLFFHDIFKPGEHTSAAQYLTGVLSLPVIAMSARAFLARAYRRQF